MRRGDLYTVALQGEHGKPRPALIVHNDLVPLDSATVTVLPLTTMLVTASAIRITVEPTPANRLRATSQIMIDRITAASRQRVGDRIGRMDAETMGRVNQSLALWLYIA